MINWYLFFVITVLVIISNFSQNILTMASKLFYRKSQFVIDKEKEVKDIESKMDGMSMVDEFAKYAKLQRKVNALKEQLKTENSKGEEPADKMKKFAIIFGIRWLWDVICSYIIWNNMNTPILHLNPSWLMPLNAVIAWPSGTPGDVGVLPFYLIVKLVIKNSHLIK